MKRRRKNLDRRHPKRVEGKWTRRLGEGTPHWGGGGVLGGKSLDGSQRQRLLSVAHASRLSNISQVRRRPLARGVQGVEDRKDNLCFLGIQYNKIPYCTEYLRTVLELVTDSVVPLL